MDTTRFSNVDSMTTCYYQPNNDGLINCKKNESDKKAIEDKTYQKCPSGLNLDKSTTKLVQKIDELESEKQIQYDLVSSQSSDLSLLKSQLENLTDSHNQILNVNRKLTEYKNGFTTQIKQYED